MTDGAKLVNVFVVMPAGVLFLVILVSTTLEVLADRTRTHYREKHWRKTLRDHIIVCGYGVKGQAAIATLLATDRDPGEIVVIDERPDVVEEAQRPRARGRRGQRQRAVRARGGRDPRGRRRRRRPRPRRHGGADHAHRARAQPAVRIVASVREGENAHLLEQGGADSVVVSSGAAGRLLGHAVHSPRVVQVLEDLLSVGSGLDIIEREVAAGGRRAAARRASTRRRR